MIKKLITNKILRFKDEKLKETHLSNSIIHKIPDKKYLKWANE